MAKCTECNGVVYRMEGRGVQDVMARCTGCNGEVYKM